MYAKIGSCVYIYLYIERERERNTFINVFNL